MTGVSHIKKAGQRLKTCEDYAFCREKLWPVFLGLLRRFIHRFSFTTTRVPHHRCDKRKIGGNALEGTVTPSLIVLTWCQVIFTYSVHSKRPEEENDLEPTMKLNFVCNDGWTNNHKLFERGIMKVSERG
jgi:hypothetical protein